MKNRQKIIEVYDTTCRDGGQMEGIDFTPKKKEELIRLIDSFGADFIEIGFVANNDNEDYLYQNKKIKNSKLAAFGSTAYLGAKSPSDLNDKIKKIGSLKDIVKKDAGLNGILRTKAKYATIFGKTWEPHITNSLKINKEQNLELIKESVSFLVKNKVEVIYDAEHFFSELFSNQKYALQTLEAAIDAGAKRIVLCDTKGGCLPRDISEAVLMIKNHFKDKKYDKIIWGFHGHNDTGMADANSLAFIEEILIFKDVVHVQGTFNGYGERSGNANINILVANINLKLSYKINGIKLSQDLTRLTKLSQEVAVIAGKKMDPHMPYFGRMAFAHKAGVHVAGDRKGASYNHVEPSLVGNKTLYLLTSQAGRDAMIWFAEQYGYKLTKDDQKTAQLLEKAKEISRQGFDLNVSDAVGELFMWDYYDKKPRILDISSSFKTTTMKMKDEKYGETTSYGGKIIGKDGKTHKKNPKSSISNGGPVASQFAVIKKLLREQYPQVTKVEMYYYEVEIPTITGRSEYSSSKVFTTIGLTDGQKSWITSGLDENSLISSYNAITDGFEYYIRKYL